MNRWPTTIAAGVLLVSSVAWAAIVVDAQQDRRIAAGEELRRVHAEAAAVLAATVGEAREELAEWGAGGALPELFAEHPRIVRFGTDETAVAVPELGAHVGFASHGSMIVDVPGASEREWLEGKVSRAELERRIVERIGPPSAGRWSRLTLIGDDGLPRLAIPAPPKEERKSGLGLLAQEGDSEAFRSIRTGRPPEFVGGSPPVYKAGDRTVVGTWGPADALRHLTLLVEVDESVALAGDAGFEVRAFGFGVRAHGWHLTLGLGVLLVLVSVFLWLPTRGTRIDVLVRVYRFARPYTLGIVGVIAVSAVFATAKSSQALLAKKLVDDVLVKPRDDAIGSLWEIGFLTLGLGLVLATTGYVKKYAQNYYSTAMVVDVRLTLGRKIISLPLGFFHRIRAGDLVARIERDVASLRSILSQVFEHAFVDPFQLVSAVVIAFMMNARLSLVLIGMPLIVYPLFRIAKRIKKRAEKRQNLLADISHVIFQMLMGIKVVKAFGGEGREIARLEQANLRFIRETRRVARLQALSEALLDLMQMAGGAILMVAGGYYVLEGEVTAGDLVAFVVIVQKIYDASKSVTGTMNKLVDAMPGTERVFEILDTEDTLKDGPREMPSRGLARGIDLEELRFSYLENEILKGITTRLPAGKVTAIVGPTGAGKTTLCDLVARFYDPDSGRVLYDGEDVREFTKLSLLANVGVVTQDAFLFNAPIDENIRYGRPGATQEEVEQAARDAFVHDEIVQMEGGYQKLAGERGSALSGGQRQRVTIARAILKDAPVLILDEATSNLDTHAEAKVQAALQKLMAGRTTIVVAHRLSTIRNADKILVLEDGAIVEEGSPGELLRREGGHFRRMYEMQVGGEEPDAAA